MKKSEREFAGQRITIMGLGLNGGGLASALHFVQRGADVTVTDLRTEEVLAPSLEALKAFKIRYVLGRHEEEDFRRADLVVKNPAVRTGNPYLALAGRIETDLSIFLAALDNPVLAVTGSKGKSTTATALHQILLSVDPSARLGGNIAVSPLTFLDDLRPKAPVVLELSSWQLADLKGRGLLRPRVAAVTNILWDHMNSYPDQNSYAADKAVVFEAQTEADWTLLPTGTWGQWMAQRTQARRAWIGSHPLAEFSTADPCFSSESGMGRWPSSSGTWRESPLLPEELQVPGRPFRLNCLTAAAMAVLYGVEFHRIPSVLAAFGGVEHRLEKFAVRRGVAYYNDTTATIPEAAAASVMSFNVPVHWIAGGTDKNLDLQAFERLDPAPASLILLKGSATERMIPVFRTKGWVWQGPFDTLEAAAECAADRARPGDVVLLSPGATSFELFRNEFHRGQAFKELVLSWPEGAP